MTDLELIERAFRLAIARLSGNGPLQYGLQIVADELLSNCTEQREQRDLGEIPF